MTLLHLILIVIGIILILIFAGYMDLTSGFTGELPPPKADFEYLMEQQEEKGMVCHLKSGDYYLKSVIKTKSLDCEPI